MRENYYVLVFIDSQPNGLGWLGESLKQLYVKGISLEFGHGDGVDPAVQTIHIHTLEASSSNLLFGQKYPSALFSPTNSITLISYWTSDGVSKECVLLTSPVTEKRIVTTHPFLSEL